MDAFFASVEQRDNPDLRGLAIAVGGASDRGVVAAASYEARKFGVKSAMPGRTAKKNCPHLIFVKPRFEAYRATSLIIRSIFREYTDLIEPLSLDEAYLDVTENKKGLASATLIAKEIRDRIFQQTELTASAGISFNKFLAKIASDENKPNGQFVITPNDAEAFLEQLPINKFFGIGKATADRFFKMGVRRGKDLKKYSKEDLALRFGKSGIHYYNVVRALDNRPVIAHRERKSIGAENTFMEDISDKVVLEERLISAFSKAQERLEKSKKQAKTITIKIKYHDFEQITRSLSLEKPTYNLTVLKTAMLDFFNTIEIEKPVRLIGCTFSNFPIVKPEANQLTLEF